MVYAFYTSILWLYFIFIQGKSGGKAFTVVKNGERESSLAVMTLASLILAIPISVIHTFLFITFISK